MAAATRPAPARRTSSGAGRLASAGRVEPFWASYDDERLLDVRMCDLGVTLEDSPLEPRLEQQHLIGIVIDDEDPATLLDRPGGISGHGGGLSPSPAPSQCSDGKMGTADDVRRSVTR